MSSCENTLSPAAGSPRWNWRGGRFTDAAMGLTAIAAILVSSAVDLMPMSDAPNTPAGAATGTAIHGARSEQQRFLDREKVASFYLAQPWYHRSDTKMQRNDGTDLTLKNMGWDGDMLMPPIDGGVRYIDWFGPAGFMIDFLHNKAVARLGKGAHGRRISNPVIETVDAEGTLKGAPAPAKLKLTDLFDRFEFTHGQNMLLFGGALRFSGLSSRVRPYVALGGGVAVPHVEVWFKGEKLENRTNEYQYVGPAASAMAGLELRVGRISYYLEYKLSWASISGLLTGDESWKNFNLPGDLLRQFRRWWSGDTAAYGSFSTTLTAHQVVIGGGWRLTPTPAAP